MTRGTYTGERKDNRDRKFGGRDRFSTQDPRGGGGYVEPGEWGAPGRMGAPRPDRFERQSSPSFEQQGSRNRKPFSEPLRRADDDTVSLPPTFSDTQAHTCTHALMMIPSHSPRHSLP